MKKNNRSSIWTYLILVGCILLLLLQAVSDRMVGSASVDSDTYGTFALVVSICAVFVFILSFVALIKVKSWGKVVPVIGITFSLLIFILSFFAFGFSGYGSPS